MLRFLFSFCFLNLYLLAQDVKIKDKENELHIISLKQIQFNPSVLVPKNEADKALISKVYSKEVKPNEHNIVLIKNPQFIALVELGFIDTIDTLKEKLQKNGVEFKDITHIILTHAHPDHIGALMSKENLFPNAKVLMDKKEYDFWTKSDRQEIKDTLLKLKNIEFINHSKDLIFPNSGIKAIPAYGHTPGHNLIMFDDNLVFWGDLIHAYDVQTQSPQIAVKFDVNEEQAIQTREKFLKEFKDKKIKVVGTHVPFSEPRILN